MRFNRSPSPFLFALAALNPVARAAPWTMPNGAAEHFTYANGRDENGIFGDPTVSGDSFIFPDFALAVSAANGTTESRADTLSVDLFAIPGWQFALMRITPFGSYAISGAGSVDVDSVLSFEELEPPGRQFDGPLATNPTFPQTSGSGGWSGLAVLDVTFEFPNPADAMRMELSNGLIAISSPGGSASIDFLYQGAGEDAEIEIGMVPIPEPASLMVLAGLVATALARRNTRN